MVVHRGCAYVSCSKQEAASLEFSSCLYIIYVGKYFLISLPLRLFISACGKKKKKIDWEYFQIHKSLLHMQLSPSVNYMIQ